jgi:beta-lactamase class A
MNQINLDSHLQNNLQKIVTYLEDVFPGQGEIKVSVNDLETNTFCSVNGKNTGWAASIIKLPVMLYVLDCVDKGNMSLFDSIEVNHKYMLEFYDFTSRQPDGTKMHINNLIYHMIVESDNEATNLLVDHLGIKEFNNYMCSLGMNKTMLGHLLCPKVPRYTAEFNEDGSNITCTDDMNVCLRQIYDCSFSKLSIETREMAKSYMELTSSSVLKRGCFSSSKVNSKIGVIFDTECGGDNHEVGIVDDRFVVSLMVNKIKTPFQLGRLDLLKEKPVNYLNMVNKYVVETIGRYYYG